MIKDRTPLFSSVYFFKDLIASVFVQNNFQITFLIRNLQLPPIKSNAYGADLLVWINSKKAIWHVKIFSGFPSWPSTHCAIGLSMHFSVMVMMVPMESATFLLKRVVLDLTEMWSIFVTLSGSWPISDQSKRLPRRTSWILERKSSNVSSGFYQVSQQGSNLKNNSSSRVQIALQFDNFILNRKIFKILISINFSPFYWIP